MKTLFDCSVRFSCGAYTTGTVRGQCASSTISAHAAVAQLAEKLYPGKTVLPQQISATIPQVWRVQA